MKFTALLLAAAGLLPACVSLERGGLFPEGRNRIFVGYFDNQTFYRDVQFLLTEQLVSEINSRPGLWLTTRDDAEILLTGKVVRVQQAVLSEDPTQIPTSSATSITVQIEIRDALSGKVIRRATVNQRGEFVPALGEDLGSAQRQAYAFLARDIVRHLETEF